MAIQRTGHVAIRVRDLDVTRAFYRDVLGMTVASDQPGRAVFFRFDKYHHDLVAFKAGEDIGPASPRHAGVLHIAFVAEDFETVRGFYRRLTAHGIPVRCTDHGFTKSIYFSDPDGIELEIYVEVPEYDYLAKGLGVREPFDIESPTAAVPLLAPTAS
ncbi:MAG TPA: VOC family protein [Candidatus Sulfotelmatobacter sp.]|nr:VOC family protein [Candidatus Sulfotelmatobacter sp.]